MRASAVSSSAGRMRRVRSSIWSRSHLLVDFRHSKRWRLLEGGFNPVGHLITVRDGIDH